MNVLVYRDGKLVCTDNPIQGTGNALDNLLMLVSEPQDGDVLKYDAANGIWVAGTGGGSFDPDITNPQDGDTLVYDGTEQKWVNGSGGGSGGGFLKIGIDMETGTLDKTWKQIHDAVSAGYYVNITTQDTETALQNTVYLCEYSGDYNVSACTVLPNNSISVATFSTDSENGYPVMQQ